MADYSTIKPIVLYDIPSNDNPSQTWGPNTAKARLALGYKRIPFTTEWVEYPSIASTMKSLGADPLLPAPEGANGDAFYTLPVIYDPNHDKYVTDSFVIAQYLDKTYPTPGRELFPEGTAPLQRAWGTAFTDAMQKGVRAVYAGVPANLNPPSREYFERTRTKRFGVRTWDEISSKLVDESDPNSRAAHLRELRAGLSTVEEWIRLNNAEGKWVMGKRLSWADIFLGSWLFWASRGLEEWKEVKGWHGGRWGRFLDDVSAECALKMD